MTANATEIATQLAELPVDSFSVGKRNEWHAHLPGSHDGITLRFAETLPRDAHRRVVTGPQSPPHKLVMDFARLHASERPAVAVAKFARRYGPLYLCEHDLPNTHSPLRLLPTESGLSRCAVGDPVIESVEAWLRWSRRIDAFIMLRTSLAHGKRGDPALWSEIAPLFPQFAQPPLSIATFDDPRYKKRLSEIEVKNTGSITLGPIQLKLFPTPQSAFAFGIRQMLQLGDVLPVMRWVSTRAPEVFVSASTLFGSIALELAEVSAMNRELKMCAYRKGHWYAPDSGDHDTTNCCGDQTCQRERDAARKRRSRSSTQQ